MRLRRTNDPPEVGPHWGNVKMHGLVLLAFSSHDLSPAWALRARSHSTPCGASSRSYTTTENFGVDGVRRTLTVTLQPLEDGNMRVVGEPGNLVVKENYWIRTDTGESGNTIDFFVKVRGIAFVETMRLLLN